MVTRREIIIYIILLSILLWGWLRTLEPKVITKRDYTFERYLQGEIDSLEKEVEKKKVIFVEIEKEKIILKERDEKIKSITDTGNFHIVDSIILSGI